MNNVVTISITGVLSYTESITLPDEMTLVVFRQLKDVLGQDVRPRKVQKRAPKDGAGAELPTPTEPAE